MTERAYRLPRQMNWLMGICALIGAGLGIGSIALPFFDPEFRSGGQIAFVLLTAPLYLAGGWYCLRIVLRSEEYGILLGPSGFRRLSDPPTRLTSWSRVARLRERSMLHRVEMLDHDGQVLGRLEYQLHEFDEALASVLASTRYDSKHVPLPHRIDGGAATAAKVTWCFLGALVLFSVVSGSPVPGLLLGALLGWAFLKERKTVRRALYVDSSTVRLTTGAGEIALAATQVKEIRVIRKPVGTGAYLLDVALVTSSGEVYLARPGTADPFHVWTTLRTAQRHAGSAEGVQADFPYLPQPQRKPRRRALVYGAALLTTLGFGIAIVGQGPADAVRVGMTAPHFPARDLLTDRKVSLQEPGRRRTTVLSFWAHDCKYCRSQLRALDSVRQLVDSSRVRVVAVHVSHDRDEAARLGRGLDLGLELWFDEDDLAERQYGIEGTPATLVIDPAGCVRYFVTGTGGVDVERLVRAAARAEGQRACNGWEEPPSDGARRLALRSPPHRQTAQATIHLPVFRHGEGDDVIAQLAE